MFCENCGKQIPDGSAFCEHCGTRMAAAPAPAPAAAPVATAEPVKKSITLASLVEQVKGIHKKNKWIFPIAGAVVLVALVAIIVLSILGKQVSVKNYLNITMEGFDGYGRMSYSFNDMAFGMRAVGDTDSKDFEDYDEDENFLSLDKSDVSKDYRADLATAQKLVNSIEISYEMPEGKTSTSLVNGDVIKFTVKYKESLAEKLGLTLTDTTFEYTVEGLDPIAQLDVLSFFDLKCEGYDGYGTVKLECNQTGSKQLGDLVFDMEIGENRIRYTYNDGYDGSIYVYISGDTYNKSNGDVISVEVERDADSFVNEGVELIGLTKDYTVSGLKESLAVDLLQYYEVTFTGIDTNGQGKITPKQETATVGEFTVNLETGEWFKGEERIARTYVYLDGAYNLTNGDEVKLYFNPSTSTFAEYGIKFTATERKITVSGLAKYISALADIKDSSALESMLKEELMNRINNDWGNTVHGTWFTSYSNQKPGDDLKLYKTVLTTPKSTDSYTKNTLWMVFSITLSDNKITTPTVYYFAIGINNAAVYTDGKVMTDDISMSWSQGEPSYDTLYQNRIEQYNVNVESSQ